MAKVVGPIKYHGGKSYLAPKIHAMAERAKYVHRAIAFAGGLGEFWNWRCEGVSESVNDVDKRIVNFYRVIQRKESFEEFARVVSAVPLSRDEWQMAKDLDDVGATQYEGVSSAAWFFVLARQSYAGRQREFSVPSRTRTRRGMQEAASAWMSAVDGLFDVHRRLSRVMIDRMDFEAFCRRNDGKDTLHYLDPPYLDETRAAKEVYRHERGDADGSSREFHARVLRVVNELTGNVILSGYPSEMYDGMLKGWRCERHSVSLSSASGQKKARKLECLWANF